MVRRRRGSRYGWGCLVVIFLLAVVITALETSHTTPGPPPLRPKVQVTGVSR